MYRSHNCGELRIKHVGLEVKLSGWIHKIRDKGSLIWVDLRDRYGITQIIIDTNESSKNLVEQVKKVLKSFYIINFLGNFTKIDPNKLCICRNTFPSYMKFV